MSEQTTTTHDEQPAAADRSVAHAGDLAMLFTSDYKRYVIRVHPEGVTHTHLGAFRHDALIGQRWGATVQSQI
ncbi:MAG: hypothetical protein KDE01_20315, partial [Caldilineaceae bacterium]|nr:hypothetical protein [Caldilineaceae bacterium]